MIFSTAQSPVPALILSWTLVGSCNPLYTWDYRVTSLTLKLSRGHPKSLTGLNTDIIKGDSF